MKKKMIGNLDGDKVIVTDPDSKAQLVQRHFGEKHLKFLVLDYYEALYLSEQDSLEIKFNNKKISTEKFIELILKKQSKSYHMHRFSVYKDLRSKGYIIKTGLKFGFDFRIYPKGKKVEESHTQFVIDVLPESEKLTNQKIAKSVRMATGLHTKLIIAIVDNELDISYYEINRVKF